MDHFGITPQLRQETQLEIRKKLYLPASAFWIASSLPVLIYFFYIAGLFPVTKKGEFEELEKATALVSTSLGTGTAFLISPTKLLTVRHVVEGMKPGEEVNLLFERLEPPVSTTATLEWVDQTVNDESLMLDYFLTDVAVLRLDDPKLLSAVLPLTLGDSDQITNLTEIIAIGYPNGSYSITRGDINSTEIEGKALFKLDSATNPGNSGGPVIAVDGETVIGMLVGQRKGIVQGENIANKINNILQLLDKAKISFE